MPEARKVIVLPPASGLEPERLNKFKKHHGSGTKRKDRNWLQASFMSLAGNHKHMRGLIDPEDFLEVYLHIKKKDPVATSLALSNRGYMLKLARAFLSNRGVGSQKALGPKAERRRSQYKRVREEDTMSAELRSIVALNDFLWEHLGYELTDEAAMRTIHFFNKPEEDVLLAVKIVNEKHIPIEYRHQYLCGVLKNQGKPVYKRYKKELT